jgi:hypothetical protein
MSYLKKDYLGCLEIAFDFNDDDYWNGKLNSCPDSQNATTLHATDHMSDPTNIAK